MKMIEPHPGSKTISQWNHSMQPTSAKIILRKKSSKIKTSCCGFFSIMTVNKE